MPVTIRTLQFQRERGCDVMVDVATLAYDPSGYTSCADAAKAFHVALNEYAASAGYGANSAALWEPEESAERGYGNCWVVSWEDGPYQWGINLSFEVTGPWGYTEPYYGFDLCFAEA